MARTRRRKVRTESEALELLDELERSGLELPAFCASHGLDGRSLNCWRHNLGGHTSACLPPPSLRLVEVVAPVADVAPSASYRLHIGAVCIEVDDHFRDATLARLLRVASTC
jgi:hypothetical protein